VLVNFIVVCRDDRTAHGDAGGYVLATRQVFADYASAAAYARTVNSSRDPLVIEGRFHELRIPSEIARVAGPRLPE
jgi:hypothetical protein